MGTNFISAFTEASTFDPETMNSQTEALDQVLTYMKNVIVSCAGMITFSNNTLIWSEPITILFTNTSGIAIRNVIPTGQFTLSANQYVYVLLEDTDGAVLPLKHANYVSGAASQVLTYNKLVLGYYDSAGAFFASPYLEINGTNLPASPAQGDLLFYDGSEWSLLPPGTAGQVLTMGGNPTWTAPVTGFPASPSQGDLVCFDGAAWTLLTPGEAGQVLTSGGTGQNPAWLTPSNSSGLPGGPVQGNIIYYNGSAWVLLPPGTAGQVLMTGGIGANPEWTTVSSGSGNMTFAKTLVLSLL